MRGSVCAALGALLLALALGASQAGATTIYVHKFLSSFDGTGSKSVSGATGPLGFFPGRIAIDEATESVYVIDPDHGVISKFDKDGKPSAFSALGAGINSIPIENLSGESDIAVDNSGGATQGQIYAFGEGQPLHAFLPSGVELKGNFPVTAPGDTCGAAVDPEGNFWWGVYGGGAVGYNSAGFPLNKTVAESIYECHIAINSAQPPSPTSGWFYFPNNGGTELRAYAPNGEFKNSAETFGATAVSVDSGDGHIYVDNSNGVDEWAPSATGTAGPRVGTFREDPYGGVGCSFGVAVNGDTHRVYVDSCGRVDIFGPGESLQIPNATADSADVTPTTAVLHGHADTDSGGDTTDCHWEYGFDTGYGNTVPCETPSGPIHDADGSVAVTSEPITFLEPGTVYHYRLVVSNVNGPSYSNDRTFRPEGPPIVSNVFASEVNVDSARLTGTVDPSGGDTRYRFDWGTTSSYGHSIPLPDFKLVNVHAPTTVTHLLQGLQGGTTYHYRLVATNLLGSDESGDFVFRTFPEDVIDDKCPNAQARRQTISTLLLDCRAYELVSAANAGGYDVQSDLVPGQVTLPAYPRASDRLLYSLHHGKIPGTTGPTNLGLDPYVATRGENGWSTTYVGIPADSAPSSPPFGSPLLQADDGLSTFAFGGGNICDPCFADGKTGIPVHLPDGSLVQGMAGSKDPGQTATTAGFVGRPMSGDGTHLVFGSTSQFEPDNSTGDVTIYDRDLSTGTTHVVSKKPDGSGTMTGAGIGELDISHDGSRILIGRTVAPDDAAGNHYWHLYMNIGDSGQTVDITPGTATGVLYDGMTADGSTLYFTTAESLLGADTDSSPDIYEADVSAAGTVSLTLVSKGSVSPSCNPTANGKGPHWNSVGATADCGAVAFAGGAGVAADSGIIYFLSPEKLDGSGTQDEPNLFVWQPTSSSAPLRVTTLDPDNPAILDAVRNNEVHSYADFQVTPNGQEAVFASEIPLTGIPNYGHTEIYRYSAPPSHTLDCVSCPPSGAAPTGDATLSSFGLNIDDASDVFFTSPDQLVLRDTNKRKDAYEWEWGQGSPQLISTGNGASDSGLVTVSADGVNAYFYTRQVLVPEDQNGAAMKIYDARAGGGFPYEPQRVPCQASDECHGPGTEAAPPPDIGTFKGNGGNLGPTHHKHRHHKHRHHRKKHRHSRGRSR
jgi:hypothetical protein